MSDDYLWDGTGPPDPEVEALERALSPLRYRPAAPVALPARRLSRPLLYAAAAVALFAAGALFALLRPAPPLIPFDHFAGLIPPRPSLPVAVVSGSPSFGGVKLAGEGQLPAGEWLETDAASRARIELPELGAVQVAPETKIRVVAAGPKEQRLELARGEVTARVDAPPRLFVIDTPSATAVDLGCAYRLRVDGEGHSYLSVETGYVSLEGKGRISIVPAGASAETRVGVGPGTPSLDDAPEAFRRALSAFDFGGDEGALKEALAVARAADAFSLWHLLLNAPEPLKAGVYERLAALSPPPPGVTREAALAGDHEALARWWESLWGPRQVEKSPTKRKEEGPRPPQKNNAPNRKNTTPGRSDTSDALDDL